MTRPLRIAQVAPPMERVPPRAYGGTERVAFELIRELDRRGHEVTTFASGDLEVPGRHITTVPEALRPAGYAGDAAPYFYLTIQSVLDHLDEFDIIHSHLEWANVLLARDLADPRHLDLPWPARPALGGGHPPGVTPGSRRDQRQPGVDPPGRPVGRHRPQRPDPR